MVIDQTRHSHSSSSQPRSRTLREAENTLLEPRREEEPFTAPLNFWNSNLAWSRRVAPLLRLHSLFPGEKGTDDGLEGGDDTDTPRPHGGLTSGRTYILRANESILYGGKCSENGTFINQIGVRG